MNATRGVLIAGNWKMNHGLKETEDFFASLEAQAKKELAGDSGKSKGGLSDLLNQKRLRVTLIPPFLSLQKALGLAAQIPFPVQIAAQNAHWEKTGAFTGEVSGPMLREIGIQSVLVGHSERRQHFGETDAGVKKRSESLLNQGFSVILCVGETQQQREANQTQQVLARQLREGLPDLLNQDRSPEKLILAYEPVWAIGTGLTATPEMAEEAQHFIREELTTKFSKEIANRMLILYGGSVTPQNIDSLLACPNVDGALVGGASLKPEGFFQLIQGGARALRN